MSGRLVSLRDSSTHYTKCDGKMIAFLNGTDPNLDRNVSLEQFDAILFTSDKPSSPDIWLQ